MNKLLRETLYKRLDKGGKEYKISAGYPQSVLISIRAPPSLDIDSSPESLPLVFASPVRSGSAIRNVAAVKRVGAGISYVQPSPIHRLRKPTYEELAMLKHRRNGSLEAKKARKFVRGHNGLPNTSVRFTKKKRKTFAMVEKSIIVNLLEFMRESGTILGQ
ncbi:hypothetical protein K438DRAFT_1764425 [Mycena galopus ATCC 62051]|nr:hypothetical protein K438DRAFT_1764425 [Mycena galopus ATCC 62051]